LFIVALIIGIYIGVKGVGNKDRSTDSPPPRDWEQKYNHAPPAWLTNAPHPTSTVYIIVEEGEEAAPTSTPPPTR
jgi:hypothetical protein